MEILLWFVGSICVAVFIYFYLYPYIACKFILFLFIRAVRKIEKKQTDPVLKEDLKKVIELAEKVLDATTL